MTPPDPRHLLLGDLAKLRLRAKATGAKSSEGDGRTAADIERELAERKDRT